MKILFVSFFFPPYSAIGAVRTGKTAKYLRSFGHDVRVVSARDQGSPATMRLELPEETVAYTRWWNPLGGAEAAARRLMQRRRGHAPSAAAAPAAPAVPRQSLLRRVQRNVRSVVNFPDEQIGWLPYARTAARRLTARWRPDVVYASSSPPTSLLVAGAVARRAGVPWVAEFRDLWVDNHNYQYPAWRRPLEDRFERTVVRDAAGFVTVSEPLAETLRRKYGRPTAVVSNGFDAADYARPAEPPRGRELRIVYTGSIYARHQSPEPLFRALALLGRDADDVRVVFYGVAHALVLPVAAACGVAHLVDVRDPIPHAEVATVQQTADVLLLLLWNDQSQPGVYAAKIYEYFGARRPILAVGYSGNVAAQLIRERGAGAALSDTESVAAHLREMLARKRAGGIDPVPPAASRGLSREEQTRELERFLLSVVNR